MKISECIHSVIHRCRHSEHPHLPPPAARACGSSTSAANRWADYDDYKRTKLGLHWRVRADHHLSIDQPASHHWYAPHECVLNHRIPQPNQHHTRCREDTTDHHQYVAKTNHPSQAESYRNKKSVKKSARVQNCCTFVVPVSYRNSTKKCKTHKEKEGSDQLTKLSRLQGDQRRPRLTAAPRAADGRAASIHGLYSPSPSSSMPSAPPNSSPFNFSQLSKSPCHHLQALSTPSSFLSAVP